MNIWRLNIKPKAQEDVDPRRFCFKQNILGVGWPLNREATKLEGEAGWQTYQESAKAALWFNHERQRWPYALNALHHKMKVDDLVWSRKTNGVYCLARVTGEWQYVGTEEHLAADIVNIRGCEWHTVGAESKVPGGVTRSFSVGGTLQRINDETVTAITKLLYNRLSESVVYEVDTGGADLFTLLPPAECEDLVALYLQEEGYRIIPSTCKHSTPRYEFVMRHKSTDEDALVQVKSGSEPLRPQDYTDLPGQVFLFSAKGGYPGPSASNVRCLDADELVDFARLNHKLMPHKIAICIDQTNEASEA